MGNKQNQRKRSIRKCPTSTQQNMALKMEVEALIREKYDLETKYKALSDRSFKLRAEAEKNECTLIKQLTSEHCTEVITKLNKMIFPVLETHQQGIDVMQQSLREESMKTEQLVIALKESQRYEPTCPVCFTETKTAFSHNAVSLPCGHLYGRECIAQWLMEQPQCPQCRKTCKPGQLRQVYINQVIQYNAITQTWEAVVP